MVCFSISSSSTNKKKEISNEKRLCCIPGINIVLRSIIVKSQHFFCKIAKNAHLLSLMNWLWFVITGKKKRLLLPSPSFGRGTVFCHTILKSELSNFQYFPN